jgi:hypothetical protein
MLAKARLGKALGGYRNLMPRTDTAPGQMVSHLSGAAADFADSCRNAICPVGRKGSGDVRVVDALLSRQVR